MICHDVLWCGVFWIVDVCLSVCVCVGVCVPAFVQRNCNLKKMMEINPLEVERRMAEAIRHFDVEVARQRAAKGRKFLLEHPSSASSWNLPSVLQLCQEIPGCRFCCVAQCRYGLKSPGTNGNEKTHQVPDEQWCHLPGVLWQEMPVQKPRPCTPKNRGFHQWCEFEQICSNLSSSAGTSGSVMLPARVLEPLRSGSKGISLPGLSTQLVQPFVHGKKSKRLIHVVLHVQRMLEKTMEFEEQVFRRIPEQEGTKKTTGFSRRRAWWIFRRILQNKISDGFLNVKEKQPVGFSRRRACWIFNGRPTIDYQQILDAQALAWEICWIKFYSLDLGPGPW